MASPRSRGNSESGFTLIEVLIVFAIIAILTAIVIPAMGFATDRSKQMATMSDMRTLAGAIMQYSIDFSGYPSDTLTAQELADLLSDYAGENIQTQDRWHHDFGYESDGNNGYTVQSFGRDGLDGTDISYDTRYDFNLDIIFDTTQFTYSPEPYE